MTAEELLAAVRAYRAADLSVQQISKQMEALQVSLQTALSDRDTARQVYVDGLDAYARTAA